MRLNFRATLHRHIRTIACAAAFSALAAISPETFAQSANAGVSRAASLRTAPGPTKEKLEAMGKLLQKDRWGEAVHGISLRPPLNSTLMQYASDDIVPPTILEALGSATRLEGNINFEPIRDELMRDPEGRLMLRELPRTRANARSALLLRRGEQPPLLRIIGESGYMIDLMVKDNVDELSIKQLHAQAMEALQLALPRAIPGPAMPLVLDATAKAQGKPAALTYLDVRDRDENDIVLGQALFRIDKEHVGILRLQAPKLDIQFVKPIFEAVLYHMQFEDPYHLQARRQGLIQQGDTWLQKFTPGVIEELLIDEQWFDIYDGKDVVGYMQVREKREEELNTLGTRVQSISRVQQGPHAVVSVVNAFVSDDNRYESVSIVRTIHPDQIEKAVIGDLKPADRTWSTTFVRNLTRENTGVQHNKVTMTLEIPGKGHQTVRYPPLPEQGYLSVVHSLLAGRLMSIASEQPMGFYSLNMATNGISFQTYQLVENKDGSYNVINRPSPSHALEISRYSLACKLITRELPSGRRVVATTKDKLRERWQIRD